MSILARVGRLETGESLVLDFGSPSSMIIQGQTRSGKSVLSYCILASLAAHLNVRVVGSDVSGLLLAPFRGSKAKNPLVALGTKDMQAHLDVFQSLTAEMDRRIELLWELGTDKLPPPTEELPLLVVVVEEYPSLLRNCKDADQGLKPAERIEPALERALGRLLQEGQKVNIRVILLMQEARAEIIDAGMRAQFATAVTLRVDSPRAVSMLHPDVDPSILALVPGFAPGMGLIQIPGFGVRRFRSSLLDFERYSALVQGYLSGRKENV